MKFTTEKSLEIAKKINWKLFSTDCWEQYTLTISFEELTAICNEAAARALEKLAKDWINEMEGEYLNMAAAEYRKGE